jgi:sulfur relay (sulfurtransferase) complex TusBCD TusD component (DsrE family)
VSYFVQYKPVDCQVHEIFIYDDSLMGPEKNSGPKKQEEIALDEHLLRLLVRNTVSHLTWCYLLEFIFYQVV